MKSLIRKLTKHRSKKWQSEYSDMLQQESAEKKFDLIYQKNLWKNPESASGSGSTLEFTKNLRASFPGLIQDFNISSIFDAPCGDMNWMWPLLNEIDVKYIGGDIVGSLIESHTANLKRDNASFMQINLITTPFPSADMMLCRDCLFHLSYQDGLKVLVNFVESGIKYLYTTSYNKPKDFVNTDIVTGSFRSIDLTRFPFDFPKDYHFSVRDGKKSNTDRIMALWTRDQIMMAVESMTKNLQSLAK